MAQNKGQVVRIFEISDARQPETGVDKRKNGPAIEGGEVSFDLGDDLEHSMCMRKENSNRIYRMDRIQIQLSLDKISCRSC